MVYVCVARQLNDVAILSNVKEPPKKTKNIWREKRCESEVWQWKQKTNVPRTFERGAEESLRENEVTPDTSYMNEDWDMQRMFFK